MTETEVQIIGAGWGRTGTSSFKKAIELLGFGKCYHMNENFDNSHADFWIKVSNGDPSFDIHSILGRNGYTATTDYPSSVYWEKQLQRYPKSKVIITYRDPESWYKSFKSTIARLQPDFDECPFGVRVCFGFLGLPCKNAAKMIHNVITRDCFNNDISKENMISSYLNYIESVKRKCPPEKLLIYNIKDGWEPLCKFLGVSVPNIPFPFGNSTKEYQSFANKINLIGYAVTVLGLGIPALWRQRSLLNHAERKADHIYSTPHQVEGSASVDSELLMQAVTYDQHQAESYEMQLGRVKRPTVAPGYAVVRVLTSSLNPLDVKIFRGYVKRMGWKMYFPFTPGYDFAGVIVAIDHSGTPDNTERFSVGDEVCGVNFGDGTHDEESGHIAGAFAEYMIVAVSKLSRKPTSVTFEAAAALPLAGLTAYQVINRCAALSSSSTVLILGGPTSVGVLAIQLAKAKGAWVAVTSSSRNIEFVKSFGPDLVINYEQGEKEGKPWETHLQLRSLDVVVDVVGEINGFKRVKENNVVKEDGVFVALSSFDVGSDPRGHPPMKWCAKFGFSQNKADLDVLLSMVANGSLLVPVSEVFHFTNDGVREMFRKVETKSSRGKNVLKVH